MFSLILLWIGVLIRLFRSRGNLVLENLVLRQQLAVLKRRHPRPSLGLFDKLCNELMLLAGVVTVVELSRVERKAPLE